MSGQLGVLGLLGLVLVVAFGSVLPVVPTGAAVSAAAVLARGERPWELLVVVLAGALGAYAGDLVVYAALRRFGTPLAQRIGWLRRDNPQAALAHLRRQIESHELRTLLLARLTPGGRVPVLVGAALGGYPWTRFASAAVAAAVLWSVVYAAIGVFGDSLFPDDTVALVVVIVLALLLGVGVQVVQRLLRRRHPEST